MSRLATSFVPGYHGCDRHLAEQAIGGTIDLGECLDLVSRNDLDLLRGAYDILVEQHADSGLEMPVNRNVAGDTGDDRVLRFLD